MKTILSCRMVETWLTHGMIFHGKTWSKSLTRYARAVNPPYRLPSETIRSDSNVGTTPNKTFDSMS